MPTIDVQSFSEQQKQKDLMKESNKALEATKEVKPEQEEPKQVQEPVVKEEVVKEEPVKELPSMDKKDESKQDIVVDVEDAMNTTPMEDFTKDDDSGMSLLERMYGVKEDRLILRDFGTFDIVDVPSRTVRNLHTGEVTTAPESKRVRLKVGTTFKDMVKSLPVCNVEKKAGKAVAEDNAELTQADA